jgi:20S proteasome alpha/beta subunit
VLKLIRTENGELGVKPAAHMISLIGYSNRNVLQSSIMVAGHDSRDGFNIVAIPMGGAKIENLNFYVTGSGGDLANSYVTANWNPNLTYAEARKIASSGKNFCSISVPKFVGRPFVGYN